MRRLKVSIRACPHAAAARLPWDQKRDADNATSDGRRCWLKHRPRPAIVMHATRRVAFDLSVPPRPSMVSRRCLEEDKGPDHDVFAASGVGGRGRVDTGGMERPARDVSGTTLSAVRAYLEMGSFFGRCMRALTTWHAYSIRRSGSSATRRTRWGIRRKR
jgi:hypothetical protein